MDNDDIVPVSDDFVLHHPTGILLHAYNRALVNPAAPGFRKMEPRLYDYLKNERRCHWMYEAAEENHHKQNTATIHHTESLDALAIPTERLKICAACHQFCYRTMPQLEEHWKASPTCQEDRRVARCEAMLCRSGKSLRYFTYDDTITVDAPTGAAIANNDTHDADVEYPFEEGELTILSSSLRLHRSTGIVFNTAGMALNPFTKTFVQLYPKVHELVKDSCSPLYRRLAQRNKTQTENATIIKASDDLLTLLAPSIEDYKFCNGCREFCFKQNLKKHTSASAKCRYQHRMPDRICEVIRTSGHSRDAIAFFIIDSSLPEDSPENVVQDMSNYVRLSDRLSIHSLTGIVFEAETKNLVNPAIPSFNEVDPVTFETVQSSANRLYYDVAKGNTILANAATINWTDDLNNMFVVETVLICRGCQKYCSKDKKRLKSHVAASPSCALQQNDDEFSIALALVSYSRYDCYFVIQDSVVEGDLQSRVGRKRKEVSISPEGSSREASIDPTEPPVKARKVRRGKKHEKEQDSDDSDVPLSEDIRAKSTKSSGRVSYASQRHSATPPTSAGSQTPMTSQITTDGEDLTPPVLSTTTGQNLLPPRTESPKPRDKMHAPLTVQAISTKNALPKNIYSPPVSQAEASQMGKPSRRWVIQSIEWSLKKAFQPKATTKPLQHGKKKPEPSGERKRKRSKQTPPSGQSKSNLYVPPGAKLPQVNGRTVCTKAIEEDLDIASGVLPKVRYAGDVSSIGKLQLPPYMDGVSRWVLENLGVSPGADELRPTIPLWLEHETLKALEELDMKRPRRVQRLGEQNSNIILNSIFKRINQHHDNLNRFSRRVSPLEHIVQQRLEAVDDSLDYLILKSIEKYAENVPTILAADDIPQRPSTECTISLGAREIRMLDIRNHYFLSFSFMKADWGRWITTIRVPDSKFHWKHELHVSSLGELTSVCVTFAIVSGVLSDCSLDRDNYLTVEILQVIIKQAFQKPLIEKELALDTLKYFISRELFRL